MSLRERVAKAIWEDRYPDEAWDYARFLAQDTPDGGNGRYLTIMGHAGAAIAAMREPTEAMCKAAISNRYQTIGAVWSGMIDAALEEED